MSLGTTENEETNVANIFQIVPSSETLQLDKEGRGEVTVTVTNIAKSVAGRALIVPIGNLDEGWLTIEGEEERKLESGIPEAVKVSMELPKDAPEGELKFRIDVVSEVNPDDDFSEGPEITVLRPPASKLWLWILLAIVFLLIVGLVAWWVVSGSKEEAPSPEEQAAAAAAADQGADEGDTVSGEPAAQTYMPNLMGLSRAEAEKQAVALGLIVGAGPALGGLSLGGDELTVAGHDPRPGHAIGEGDTVTFELSADMPDLVGMEEGEAGLALLEAGIWPGEVNYRISDRQEAGKVLEQSVPPKVETKAGNSVDITFSLGTCEWSPSLTQGFGSVGCRSGSAISGLYCSDKPCGVWQLYCCPYSPTPDLEAELSKSDWISPKGTIANRKDSFLDAWECRESGCSEMQARYLKTPRLKKGSECRSFDGSSSEPVRCGEGQFVAEFACLSGKTCNAWRITCCPGESIPPE